MSSSCRRGSSTPSALLILNHSNRFRILCEKSTACYAALHRFIKLIQHEAFTTSPLEKGGRGVKLIRHETSLNPPFPRGEVPPSLYPKGRILSYLIFNFYLLTFNYPLSPLQNLLQPIQLLLLYGKQFFPFLFTKFIDLLGKSHDLQFRL